MQKLRGGIKAVGPHHRSRLFIDPHLPEVLGIAQGFPERPAKQEGTVDIAYYSIVERDSKAVAVKRMDIGDSEHRLLHARARLDRRQGLQFLGARPVVGEFLRMEACPSPDEPQCRRWKGSIEGGLIPRPASRLSIGVA
jgi:hypothetical protein